MTPLVPKGVEHRLAFSTNAYLKFSFAEACRRVAALGYAGVEVMADVPHAWPAWMLDEQKQALRDALARNKLAISNINGFMMHAVNDPRQRYWHPSWIEPDPHYRQIRIDHTRRCLTLARELGAPCITTEPGGPVEPGASWPCSEAPPWLRSSPRIHRPTNWPVPPPGWRTGSPRPGCPT